MTTTRYVDEREFLFCKKHFYLPKSMENIGRNNGRFTHKSSQEKPTRTTFHLAGWEIYNKSNSRNPGDFDINNLNICRSKKLQLLPQTHQEEV